jgi:hypothetical protein
MSKFYPQITDEVAQQTYTHRFDFSYLDIPAGIAVNTAQVFLLPKVVAGDEVIELFVRLVTPFANSADAAFNSTTIDIGDDVSPTTYATAIQLNLNGTNVPNTHIADKNNVYTAAHQLQIRLNSMAAKSLSNLNQGQLWIDFNIFRASAKEKNLVTPFGKGYT